VNYKKLNLLHEEGIRVLLLKRNNLSDEFAIRLQRVLSRDKYIKYIDLSGNNINEYGLEVITKLGLI
jgi:hypothetical protein